MEKEIRYYSDEVHDDFANTAINTRRIDGKFKYYTRNPLVAIRRFIVYRCIVFPIIVLYNKVIRRVTYKNKKCMKGYKKQSCFIYGNHTMFMVDAFNPSYLSCPRRAEVVVNEDTVSIPGIRWLVMDLGAMPIPSDIHMMGKFADAIDHAVRKKSWIAIYPEAHIWPYYTGVRNFPAVSFRYPVKYKTPVFTYTVTYSRRKHFKKPKITVYVDGPFFPDEQLPAKQAAQQLRDQAYAAMKARCDEHSAYSYKYEYVYKEKGEDAR